MIVAFVALLGGFSLYLNKDLFAGDNIHIFHRCLPARGRQLKQKLPGGADSEVNPVVFGFDRKLKLTSLQVIPISDIETSKYPHAIWYLVSESNSIPTKSVTYGVPIKGMHPKVAGSKPDSLQLGSKYRLFVEAGTLKAEHDFEPVAKPE